MKAAIRIMILAFVFGLITSPLLAQRQTEASVSWYNRGTKATSSEEKIKCFSKAIELVPEFIEAHYYLGHTYKNIGELEKAKVEYQIALDANPAKLNKTLKRTILFELGLVLEKSGLHNDAEQVYLEALSIAEENTVKATIYNMLGNIMLSSQQFDKAINYYERGKEAYPINANSFSSAIERVKQQKTIVTDYDKATKEIARNNYEEGIKLLEAVADINPEYKDVSKLLSDTKQKLESKELVDNVQDFYQQGLNAMRQEDWKAAIESFELVTAKTPDYQDVQRNLATAQQNYKSKIKADNLDRLYDDGNAAVQRGDYIKALIAYERISEIDPEYKNVAFKIQQILQKTDKQSNASTKSKYYAQGVEAYENEEWQTAYNQFNRVLAMDSDFEDVQIMLEKTKNKMASSTREGTIELYYQKGLDYYNQQNWLYAIINFEKVHMLDAEYKDVATLITQARKQFDGDESGLATTSTETSGGANPLVMVGIILSSIFVPFWAMVLFSPTARARFYLMQKRYDKAGEIYERMLKSKPENVKLYITLANIYINENRKDEYALRVFKKVVEADVSHDLKKQIVPIINQHYLQKGHSEKSTLGLLEDSLKEELKKMGN
ncbi:tetratricopeptide repeat protein [candidate division KSB1 bacterium]|nr:tetratricopeptide repeat protein [candidate division KSB1 bacterium]